MDARTPLTDEPLDQALGALLNERPSAAFEARVRARVAAEVPGSVWRHRWPLAALSAAALATAAALLVVLSPPPHTELAPAPSAATQNPAPPASAQAAASGSAPGSVSVPPSVAPPQAVSGAAATSASTSVAASASVAAPTAASAAPSVSASIQAAPGDASMRPPAPARDSGELADSTSAAAVPQRARVSDFPEVLVSDDEVRTFQRLVALSQEPPRPEAPPAEITVGQRGAVQLPPLSFDPVVIDEPALAALTLE